MYYANLTNVIRCYRENISSCTAPEKSTHKRIDRYMEMALKKSVVDWVDSLITWRDEYTLGVVLELSNKKEFDIGWKELG